MPETPSTIIRDATPLYDGARALHGYFLYTWFTHFLGVLLHNIQRWRAAGQLDDAARASPAFRQLPVDFNALDLEKLAYFCGIYFYVESAHKQANYRLMHPTARKRVLYLRGFDYEAAVAASDTLAVGIATVDTTRFNYKLGELLGAEFDLFKAMSPKDLYWETIGPQRYFYGDYEALIRSANQPIRSVHLNARYWKDDIAQLAGQVDYFVVYVSSITESVLWEMHHLIDTGRAPLTTVVFDREAILTKNIHADLYKDIPALAIGPVRWLPSRARSSDDDIRALRDELEKVFTVIDIEDLDAEAPALMARIRAAAPDQPDAQRNAWLDFRFYPALDDATLDYLRRLDAALWAEVEPEAGAPIDALPFRINQILLRVFTALLFGQHRDAGCALAVYAGIMKTLLDHYTAAGRVEGFDSPDDFANALGALTDHHATAAEISWAFLCSGQPHEFGNYTAAARADYDRLFAAARQQTKAFLRALHAT